MPLPPLPDPAVIGGPSHVSDSQKLTNYLRALAEQDKVDLDIPDPAPGHGGHIEWHNAMVAGAKKVAAAIGAQVTLPPDVVKDKDLDHVTHHNLLAKALADMAAAVPFSVEGGTVWDGEGMRAHVFSNTGSHVMKVFGRGKVSLLIVAGGGGSGFTNYQSGPGHYELGGGGGGGVVYGMNDRNREVPVEEVSSGQYTVTVGGGGSASSNPSTPGFNGEDSSVFGSNLSLVAQGGGGGGSSSANGANAGTGGGAGLSFDADTGGATNFRGSNPGQGNPGFGGAVWVSSPIAKPGGAGSSFGPALPENGGDGPYWGIGLARDQMPAWLVDCIEFSVGPVRQQQWCGIGAGGSANGSAQARNIGNGGQYVAFNPGVSSGEDGIVVVAYPHTELLRAED